MYYPRKRYGRKKAAPRRKYAAKKRVYKKKTNLVKTIKQTISRMAENKIWTNYGANQTLRTAVADVPFQLGLLPTLSQGTTVQQRVGNQARIVKSYLHYRVNLLPYNATNNPIPLMYLKIWIVSLKTKSQTQGSPTTSDYNDFFQSGSTSFAFRGDVLDTLFDVNNDMFTVHTTRFHTLGTISSTALTSLNVYSGANSPCAEGKIYLEKYVKNIKYNDGDTDVSNKSLWMVAQPVRADGTTGTSELTCEMHYTHNVQFEDL